MRLYGAIYESPTEPHYEPNKNPHNPVAPKAGNTTPSTPAKKDNWLLVIVLIALMISAGYLMSRRP